MTGPDIAVPPPAPRRGWKWGVLVVGVVVGAGTVGAMWAFTSGDPAAGTDGDVATACSLIRRTGPMTADARLDPAGTMRWLAAGSLMYDAGADHPEYQPLLEALSHSPVITPETSRNEGPVFEAAFQRARQFCADH